MNHNHYMNIAEEAAKNSKDTSTKVGSAIVLNDEVLITSCNNFPEKLIELPERFKRPQKYLYTEHAERAAIYKAVKKGISLEGSTIYISCLFPCADCARAIVLSGIKTLVTYKVDFENPRWKESYKIAKDILQECGIEIIEIEYKLDKERLDYIVSKTNRSNNQTQFLYNLLDGDFQKLKELEIKIKNNFIHYCPGDMESVEMILGLENKSNYFEII